MPKIRVSEILPFTCEQMYNVVADVEKYPKFLPWCSKTRVWDKQDNQFMAELTVSFKGIREKFQTLDILEPHKKIEVNLKSGPFQYLVSTWHFNPIGDDRTKVEFFIDFRFSSKMKEMIMGPVFTQVSKQMISAFKKRAIALHRR
jgi:coenzyme Q-binding protein COQ10